MAKNQSSKNPARSSYERISRATFSTFYRISHCPKTDNAPNPPPSTTDNPKARVFYTQPNTLHQPVSGEGIPSESVPPEVKPVKKFVRFSSKNVKKNGDSGGKELAGQKTFSEEKYNSYIDRTKMKMRAPSDVGGGRAVSRHESFNDRVSNYISRAKLKLRASSNMGAGGKAVSFKETMD